MAREDLKACFINGRFGTPLDALNKRTCHDANVRLKMGGGKEASVVTSNLANEYSHGRKKLLNLRGAAALDFPPA